jgi:toxin HigB-1
MRTILLVILILLLLGALPLWPHSAGWGYYRSGGIGLILLVLIVLILMGSMAGIQPRHAKRLRLIRARLHASTAPQDMRLSGLQRHPLAGDRGGEWAVSVSGNWRVTFQFVGTDAVLVNYEDYH